jgi:catechol 2,3-dioxygenase-like lactoylglutathione lyase family enzyme
VAHETHGIFDCRPLLPVRDMARSLAFYRDLLGFTVGWRCSDNAGAFLSDGDDSTPDTALVGRDGVQFILGTQGTAGTWLHLDVASAGELDSLHDEWRARGVTISEPPTVRPWDMYEMRIVDPDGHTFRVSAPPP